MHATAHISFEGGGLILPAQTPYEQQLLFEHVEASTKRYGHVGLSAKGRHWTISLNAVLRQLCTRCPRLLQAFTYRSAGRNFCGHCVRHALL
jgi:hypothetical protein